MVNNNDFVNRLKEIINLNDETASSFAEKIGVQRSSISHLLSGRNKPSLDFVMKILHTYPKIDLYWLLNGTGTVFAKTEHKTFSKPDLSNKVVTPNLFTSNVQKKDDTIDKIVIFYKDGTFKSYQN